METPTQRKKPSWIVSGTHQLAANQNLLEENPSPDAGGQGNYV
jgi:hypothetical protein